jgi:hypothetical protein
MEIALFTVALYLGIAIVVGFRILMDKSIDNSTGFVFLAIGASILWPIVLTIYLVDKN